MLYYGLITMVAANLMAGIAGLFTDYKVFFGFSVIARIL